MEFHFATLRVVPYGKIWLGQINQLDFVSRLLLNEQLTTSPKRQGNMENAIAIYLKKTRTIAIYLKKKRK